MPTIRSKTWSWMEDVLPFAAMLTITCLDMSLLTVVKAAMNGGLSSIVYVVYHDALGTLILLPFFIIHIFRNVTRPQLTFQHLFRFFILGLLGAIGAMVVAAGFYSVMWGQSKEKNTSLVVIGNADEPGSSDQTISLLSSRNESEC